MCIKFLGYVHVHDYVLQLNFIINLKWKMIVNGPGATTNLQYVTGISL